MEKAARVEVGWLGWVAWTLYPWRAANDDELTAGLAMHSWQGFMVQQLCLVLIRNRRTPPVSNGVTFAWGEHFRNETVRRNTCSCDASLSHSQIYKKNGNERQQGKQHDNSKLPFESCCDSGGASRAKQVRVPMPGARSHLPPAADRTTARTYLE